MKPVKLSNQYKKDLRLMDKRGYRIQKVIAVVDLLRAGEQPPPKNRDHPLQGEWGRHRECHIEPDWLLIYRVSQDEIELVRTGTHSDLFG